MPRQRCLCQQWRWGHRSCREFEEFVFFPRKAPGVAARPESLSGITSRALPRRWDVQWGQPLRPRQAGVTGQVLVQRVLGDAGMAGVACGEPRSPQAHNSWLFGCCSGETQWRPEGNRRFPSHSHQVPVQGNFGSDLLPCGRECCVAHGGPRAHGPQGQELGAQNTQAWQKPRWHRRGPTAGLGAREARGSGSPSWCQG